VAAATSSSARSPALLFTDEGCNHSAVNVH